jgi:hypothetical protein
MEWNEIGFDCSAPTDAENHNQMCIPVGVSLVEAEWLSISME